MDTLLPRFRWGNILPSQQAVRLGPGYQFYRLVPLDIMEVEVALGIADYTVGGVEEAMANFWPCVELLVRERVSRVVFAGAPISAQLGRPRVRELLAAVEQKMGVPADAPLEAVIAAMSHLGLTRIAVASRWADELNRALAGYLQDGGLEVVGVTSRGQWSGTAHAMALEEAMRMNLEVGREAARLASRAEAILVPGGVGMTLSTIVPLEEEFGKPVLTNTNAEIWNGLVRTGVIPPVQGWGKLLATP